MITEPTPLTILLNRYNQLLNQPYEPNPYFKSELEYKQEVREKIKEIQLTSKNHNPLTLKN